MIMLTNKNFLLFLRMNLVVEYNLYIKVQQARFLMVTILKHRLSLIVKTKGALMPVLVFLMYQSHIYKIQNHWRCAWDSHVLIDVSQKNDRFILYIFYFLQQYIYLIITYFSIQNSLALEYSVNKIRLWKQLKTHGFK